jgi:hypothetical protein
VILPTIGMKELGRLSPAACERLSANHQRPRRAPTAVPRYSFSEPSPDAGSDG